VFPWGEGAGGGHGVLMKALEGCGSSLEHLVATVSAGCQWSFELVRAHAGC
jgi:hypothetical protein